MQKTSKPRALYIDNPAFDAPDATALLYPPGEPLPPLPPIFHMTKEWRRQCGPPLDAPTKAEERGWFLQYNYARRRVAQGGDEVATWSRRASHMEDLITRRNLPLVAYAYGVDASRLVAADFDDVFSNGMSALLRCVRAFDVARGLKFSTLAVLAIRRDFYSNRPRALKRGSDWRQTGMDYADGVASIKECGRLAFRDDAAFLGELIDANVADRTPKEQQVIRDRFGLGGGECRTLEEIGVDLGITKERVRQIQLKTLVKLREALSPLVLVK